MKSSDDNDTNHTAHTQSQPLEGAHNSRFNLSQVLQDVNELHRHVHHDIRDRNPQRNYSSRRNNGRHITSWNGASQPGDGQRAARTRKQLEDDTQYMLPLNSPEPKCTDNSKRINESTYPEVLDRGTWTSPTSTSAHTPPSRKLRNPRSARVTELLQFLAARDAAVGSPMATKFAEVSSRRAAELNPKSFKETSARSIHAWPEVSHKENNTSYSLSSHLSKLVCTRGASEELLPTLDLQRTEQLETTIQMLRSNLQDKNSNHTVELEQAKEKIEQQQKKIDELRAENTLRNDELSTKTASEANMQQVIEKLSADLETLKEKAATAELNEKEIIDLKKQLEQEKAKRVEFQEKLVDKDEELSKARHQLDDQLEINNAKEQLKTVQCEKAKLQKELEAEKTAAEALRESYREVEQNSAGQCSVIEQLRKQIDLLQADVDDPNNLLRETQSELAEKSGTVQYLQDKLDAALAVQKDQAAELDSLQNTYKETETKLEVANTTNEQLREELQELRNTCDANKHTIKAFREELETARITESDLHDELVKLKADINTKQEAVESLQRQLESLEKSKLKEKELSVQDLTAEQQRSTELNEKLFDVEKTLENLQKEHSSLKQQLSASQEDVSALREEQAKTFDAEGRLNAEEALEYVREQLNDALQQVEHKNNVSKTLQAEIENMKEKQDRDNTRINDLQDQLSVKDAIIEELSDKLESTQKAQSNATLHAELSTNACIAVQEVSGTQQVSSSPASLTTAQLSSNEIRISPVVPKTSRDRLKDGLSTLDVGDTESYDDQRQDTSLYSASHLEFSQMDTYNSPDSDVSLPPAPASPGHIGRSSETISFKPKMYHTTEQQQRLEENSSTNQGSSSTLSSRRFRPSPKPADKIKDRVEFYNMLSQQHQSSDDISSPRNAKSTNQNTSPSNISTGFSIQADEHAILYDTSTALTKSKNKVVTDIDHAPNDKTPTQTNFKSNELARRESTNTDQLPVDSEIATTDSNTKNSSFASTDTINTGTYASAKHATPTFADADIQKTANMHIPLPKLHSVNSGTENIRTPSIPINQYSPSSRTEPQTPDIAQYLREELYQGSKQSIPQDHTKKLEAQQSNRTVDTPPLTDTLISHMPTKEQSASSPPIPLSKDPHSRDVQSIPTSANAEGDASDTQPQNNENINIQDCESTKTTAEEQPRNYKNAKIPSDVQQRYQHQEKEDLHHTEVDTVPESIQSTSRVSMAKQNEDYTQDMNETFARDQFSPDHANIDVTPVSLDATVSPLLSDSPPTSEQLEARQEAATASLSGGVGSTESNGELQWHETLEFLERLLHGIKMIKHGRWGKPHPRLFWLDATCDFLVLRWGKIEHGTDTNLSTNRMISLSEFDDLVVGKVTPVFKRNKRSDGKKYISMLTDIRTLDMEMTSEHERDWIFRNLRRILTEESLLQDMLIELFQSGRYRPPGMELNDEEEQEI